MWYDKIYNYLQVNLDCDDAAHDISHCERVTKRALYLAKNTVEDVNCDVLIAAGLLHDIVNVPKNSVQRSQASTLSADHAMDVLRDMNFPPELLDDVYHCIQAHSFSANIEPTSIEAKIIQDSDRLDALGAIGVLRCFYVAGRMGSQIMNNVDPLAVYRELDDTKYALDHFPLKLYKIADTMKTEAGHELGQKMVIFMKMFRNGLAVNNEYYLYVTQLALWAGASNDSLPILNDVASFTKPKKCQDERLTFIGEYLKEIIHPNIGQ